MNLRKALATTLLAGTLFGIGLEARTVEQPDRNYSVSETSTPDRAVSENAATRGRRRAVRHPGPPSHIMQQVSADDDLRYTNLDTAANVVTTRVQDNPALQATDILQPGQSVTKYDLVRLFGKDVANLEIYSTGKLEARGTQDAIPTSLATTSRQTIPIMSLDQKLDIWARSGGEAEVKLLTDYGVQRDTVTINLMPGTTTLSHNFTLKVGEQLDIIPAVPTIATSTVNGVQYRAKALTEAAGQQYIIKADNSTTAWVKNVDPAGILLFNTFHYPQDKDNLTSGFTQALDVLNWGTKKVTNMTNGSTGTVMFEGQWVSPTYTPHLVWSDKNVQAPQNAAIARSGMGSTNTEYNLSLNQVPDVVSLFTNITSSTTTGSITGVNDAGTTVGTLNYSLPSHGNKEVNLTSLKSAGATRIILSVDKAASNISFYPEVYIQANINGIMKAGEQYVKPIPVVPEPTYNITAEIYVKDNGQVFMQKSNPTAEVMKKLLNLENLLFYDDKLISYACESFPDPIVNTLPELINNYQTKLTTAEKQVFSGDEEGFRPYAANPCSSAPQNVYLVRVTFDRIN